MRGDVTRYGLVLSLVLGCNNDPAWVVATRSPGGAGGQDAGASARERPSASERNGATPASAGGAVNPADAREPADAAVDAGGASTAGAVDGKAGGAGEPSAGGSSGPVLVTLDPSSIEIFQLPVGSTRVAAAGFDPEARVCVSVIWDYSNNALELARHCDDFLSHAGFPYVLVDAGRDQPCPGYWGYEGAAPSVASGCIDPLERRVNVQLELERDGVRYAIDVSNEPGSR